MNSVDLDYSLVMGVLKKADQDFTHEHGCGAPYQLWDKALESSVEVYNESNGTMFDPVEARHLYIEEQERYWNSHVGQSEIRRLVSASTSPHSS